MNEAIKAYRRLVAVIGCVATLTACSAHSNSHSSPSVMGSSPAAGSTAGSASSADQPTPAAGACPAAALGIRRGPRLSPAAGEHGVIVSVIGLSAPCTITGYPTVRINDAAGSPMHFIYVFGKGQYVTHRRPQPVTIGGGRVAYFLVAKYRCDTGTGAAGFGMNISLPGQGTTYSVPTDWLLGAFSFCTGGVNPDPGNTVAISPFEPAVDLLAR